MQIEIPVKAHVKAFLLSPRIYGPKQADEPAEPIEVRKDSYIGHLLSGFLERYPMEEIPDSDSAGGAFPDDRIVIRCTFPVNPAFLTDTNLMHLGEMLEYLFKWSLILFTQGAMSIHPSEQGAVKRFYRQFGLSEELYDYEAAFKVAQRFRNRGERPDPRRTKSDKKRRPVLSD